MYRGNHFNWDMQELACVLVLFTLLPLSPRIQAEDEETSTKVKRREALSPVSKAAKKAGIQRFQPKMLGHFFTGCPSNSSCSKEMGFKRQKWSDLLKKISRNNYSKQQTRTKLENFRKKNGIPFSLWTTIRESNLDFVAEEMPNVISWRSRCDQHQPSDESGRQAIYSSEVMVKNLKDLPNSEAMTEEKKERYIFNQGFLLANNGKFKRYIIPRDETPVMLDGQELIFLKEEEGHYYSLSISPKGDIHLGPSHSPSHFPQETTCPKELQKAFAKSLDKKNLHHLYQQFFCQKIWNRQTQTSNTMIFGWSCH